MSVVKRVVSVVGVTALSLGVFATVSQAVSHSSNTSGQSSNTSSQRISFKLARSANIVKARCVPKAAAHVDVVSSDGNQSMRVHLYGLPPHTRYTLFVTQVPHPPFGVSWYQGSIDTDKYGDGSAQFRGRFNVKTFAVAPGIAPAPVSQPGSAASNPAFQPIQMYHVGVWFDSPQVAARAGCGATVTPFNGVHKAGVLVLNSGAFGDLNGPLRSLSS